MTALLDAPCIFCGYNGQRYYSEWTHAKSCPWHSVGGAAERTEQLRMVIQEQAERLEAAGREIAALREHYETSLELESALHAKIEERQAAQIAALRAELAACRDEGTKRGQIKSIRKLEEEIAALREAVRSRFFVEDWGPDKGKLMVSISSEEYPRLSDEAELSPTSEAAVRRALEEER